MSDESVLPSPAWRIETVALNSALLPHVIRLGDKNKPSVGLMPKGAFEDYANRGQILAAVDRDGKLAGYLLYRTVRNSETAVITHLCVEAHFRGQGVARALFDRVRNETSQLCGIRLRCRKDYEASGMWPKLGFKSLREMAGRAKDGKPLVEWWFDYGRPTLFDSPKARPPGVQTIRVVLDANVYFDLHSERSQGAASRALLADWVGAVVEIQWLVTPELSRERDRGKTKIGIEYPVVHGESTIFDQVLPKVSEVLYGNVPTERLRARDHSDARQIAHAITAGETCYLTRDQDVLAKGFVIRDKFNLEVLDPLELLARLDRIRDAQKYAPVLLQDRKLQFAPLDPKSIEATAHQLLHPGERKAELVERLRSLMTKTSSCELRIVVEGAQPLALIGWDRKDSSILRIAILRIAQGLPARETLMRFLLWHTVEKAIGAGIPLVGYEDVKLESPDILADCDFIRRTDGWWRTQLSGEFTGDSLAKSLRSIGTNALGGGLILELADQVGRIATTEAAEKIERMLWPARFTGRGIPSFLVPIRPHWAKELFDYRLAGDFIFKPASHLILNTENIYYSAAIPPGTFRRGCRILWYVSADVYALRAISLCDEVVVDDPRRLFRRYRSLGIYEWSQIHQMLEKGRKKKKTRPKPDKIMAIRFSHTRLIDTPVPYKVMEAEYLQRNGKKLSVQFPIQIDETIVRRWIALGGKSNG